MAQMIISTDIEPVNVQAFGNWFSFKPGQIKAMDPNIVDFLCMNKRSFGFVALPDVCGEDREAPESKAAIAAAIREGRANILKDLEQLKYNLEVSLQKDYDMAGLKVNAVHMEGKHHLPMYRKLAEFKKLEAVDNQPALDEIAELKGLIDGNSEPAHPKDATKGSKKLP